MVMAIGSDFTHVHALIAALHETGGTAREQEERFAAIGPSLIWAGGGPLGEYTLARHWRPGDGGSPNAMRRCAVAERVDGGSEIVFFHCAAKLTLPQIRAFRADAAAAGSREPLVITTAAIFTGPASEQAAQHGVRILSLLGMEAPAIGDGVLTACAAAVRSGSPPMFPIAA